MENLLKDIRKFWVEKLTRMAHPVLMNMANDTLKANMPLKQHPEAIDREYCTYLEALGRVLCGMAPWFNAKNIEEEERKQQAYYLNLSLRAIANAVDEDAEDFSYDKKSGKLLPQVLVDTAFLACAFIRSKESLWDGLDTATQKRVIKYFKETRGIQPGYNNWLLFSSMVEAFFCCIGEPYDMVRIDYGVKQMENWYVGDGLYSDGKSFNLDYYNSYVIQPFLIEILKTVGEQYKDFHKHYPVMIERAKRYARTQEMAILPDGTFAAHGRSVTYRVGAFHHLATMATMEVLPKEVSPQKVRRALTKVIARCLEAEGTYDKDGWLNIGLFGNQPSLGESYISTGSLYLCSTGFLPLGLDGNHEFWTGVSENITMEDITQGIDVMLDHAL